VVFGPSSKVSAITGFSGSYSKTFHSCTGCDSLTPLSASLTDETAPSVPEQPAAATAAAANKTAFNLYFPFNMFINHLLLSDIITIIVHYSTVKFNSFLKYFFVCIVKNVQLLIAGAPLFVISH
jgi:hypothetical protein